jgi:hypothetical protein
MGFLAFVSSALQTLFNPPVGEVAPSWGRAEDTESVWDAENPDTTFQNEGTAYLDAMGNDAYIAAAHRYRDISRLVVSMAGINAKPEEEEERRKTGQYHPPQIINPVGAQEDIWKFICWNLDTRLLTQRTSLKVIISRMQKCYIRYGYCLLECIYQNEETPYGLRTVLVNMKDIDPDRVIMRWEWSDGTPITEEPYRQNDITTLRYYIKEYYQDSVNLIPCEERKFMLITQGGEFGNPYGKSEYIPVIRPEYGRRNVSGHWERHLESRGSPPLAWRYPQSKAGSQHDTWRATQCENIARMQSQSVVAFPAGDDKNPSTLEPLISPGEVESFKDYVELKSREIAVVLCGSDTALSQGKYGSFSREESTTVRQKSEYEQDDAALISDAFSSQVIRWLVDFNYGEQDAYPYMQLVEPKYITPTQPKEQEEREEEGSLDIEKPEKKEEQEEFSVKVFEDVKKNEEDEEITRKQREPGKHPEKGMIKSIGFPAKETPPPDYEDEEIQQKGREFLGGVKVLTPKEFDKLGNTEKRTAWTIHAIDKQEALEKLFDLIKDSLSTPQEAEAWKSYESKARKTLREYGIALNTMELSTSFRMGRILAYNMGIEQKAYELDQQGKLHGLRYDTREDADVRFNHWAADGVLLPRNHPFWADMLPPNGFGCRCKIFIVTTEMFATDPQAYQYTDIDDISPAAKPDPGFEASYKII